MPARLALTQLALRREDPDVALKFAAGHLENESQQRRFDAARSSGSARKGQFDEARALLDKILKANPNQADTLLEMGVLNLMQKRYKEAEESFRKAYAVDPSNLRGLLGVAEVYFQQNEPDKAIQVITDEVEKQPQRADLKKELANVELRAKQYDKAIPDYQAMLDQYKDAPAEQAEIYSRHGITYSVLGNGQQAIEDLRKAKPLAPTNVAYISQLAQF